MRDRQLCKTSISSERTLQTVTIAVMLINVHSTTGNRQYYLPLWLMYRLPFELTDSAKLLHFTILGGSADNQPPPPLNDATVVIITQPVSSLAVSRKVEGWVDLSTAVKVRSSCPRLYVKVVAINTTVCEPGSCHTAVRRANHRPLRPERRKGTG